MMKKFLFLQIVLGIVIAQNPLSFAQSLYEQRANEIAQKNAREAVAEEAAFPSKANAYFLNCVRKTYGNVRMNITKGGFPSNYAGAGIISSADFVKGNLACYAFRNSGDGPILVNCIDGNHHESGMRRICNGY
jgi:hypothetical protein